MADTDMPVRISNEPIPADDELTHEEKAKRLNQVHGALQFAHDTLYSTLPDQTVIRELQSEIMDTIVLLNQARRDAYGHR